jgi:hypothetical protein
VVHELGIHIQDRTMKPLASALSESGKESGGWGDGGVI